MQTLHFSRIAKKITISSFIEIGSNYQTNVLIKLTKMYFLSSIPADVATDFFHQVAEAIDGEKEKTLFDCFQPILDSLKASVEEDRSLSRSSGVFQCLDVVLFFAQHNLLAKVWLLI